MHKPNGKLPANLVLTAQLSSGITGVVSITYIILSILGLIYRFNCNAHDEVRGSQYFWTTIYRVYIQDLDCNNEPVAEALGGLTRSFTVFVFLAITLSFSVVTLITSIILMSLINNEDSKRYINIIVYTYVISWVASLIVDLTFASHLGMDYKYLGNRMGTATPNDLLLIVIREGAVILMAISLKGFAIHAINLALILMMIVYLYDYQDMSKQDEHSIHKIGAINAFDQPRRHEDNWVNPDMYAGPSYSRGQTNNGFSDDEPRTPNRNDFYLSRTPSSYHRSNSWNHQPGPQQVAPQPTPSIPSSRPFSYLEEVRRPVPVKSPVSPPSNDNWRGAWPGPPVPAPDYSPHSPRRLKSALKPNYM